MLLPEPLTLHGAQTLMAGDCAGGGHRSPRSDLPLGTHLAEDARFVTPERRMDSRLLTSKCGGSKGCFYMKPLLPQDYWLYANFCLPHTHFVVERLAELSRW